MSILSALKTQEGSLRELAMLPQAQILKMAQMGQLDVSMVPVILNEKAQMAQQVANMQAMAQGTPPSIIEQAMAINAQADAAAAPPAGLEALPVRDDMYSEQSMAAGGIVAFANGGLADDEEEDDDSFDRQLDRENEGMIQQLMAMRRSGSDMGDLGSGLRPTTTLREAQRPQAAASTASAAPTQEARGSGLRMPSNHKYAQDIVAQAEKIGLDPNFALSLAMKETGGLRNPESARSRAGALGVMQLMPGTARDMGVEDPLDPQQNIAGGLRYAKMMLEKYQDPKIAAIAYNWGPGNTDKWLRAGADMSKLPKETQNYVANLKEGGAIRFQNTGFVDPVFSAGYGDDTFGTMTRDELVKEMTLAELQEYNRTGTIPPRLRDKVGGRTVQGVDLFNQDIYRTEKPTPAPLAQAATPAARAMQSQYEAQDIQEGDVGRLATPATAAQAIAATQQAAEATSPAKTMSEKLEALLAAREAGISKQREQDKYMALLTAGLGMMGGTSPYALQNIGAGAMQGVASMQASAKQRAAEENAILSGRLGQARLEQNEALRRELTTEAQQNKILQQLGTARQNMLKNVIAAKKLDITTLDQNQLARLEEEADAMLARDPSFQAMYKKIYGAEFAPSRAAAGPVDYLKNYGLTPRKQ